MNEIQKPLDEPTYDMLTDIEEASLQDGATQYPHIKCSRRASLDRDGGNHRYSGTITHEGHDYEFTIQSGNWSGTVVENWERVAKPAPAEPAQKVKEDPDRDRSAECVEGEPYEYWCRAYPHWARSYPFRKTYIGMKGYKFRPVQKEPAVAADPYAELKKARAEGKVIECFCFGRADWYVESTPNWNHPHGLAGYRIATQPPADMPAKPTPPPGYRLLEKHELTGLRHPDAIVFWQYDEKWSAPGVTLDGKHGHFFALPITEPSQPTPAEMMAVAALPSKCPDCGAARTFHSHEFYAAYKCNKRIIAPHYTPYSKGFTERPCPKKPAADKPAKSITTSSQNIPPGYRKLEDHEKNQAFIDGAMYFAKQDALPAFRFALGCNGCWASPLDIVIVPIQPSPESEPEPNQETQKQTTNNIMQTPKINQQYNINWNGKIATVTIQQVNDDNVFFTGKKTGLLRRQISGIIPVKDGQKTDWNDLRPMEVKGAPVQNYTGPGFNSPKPPPPTKPSLLWRVTKPILKWTFATGTSAAVTAVSILGPTAAKAGILYYLSRILTGQ